MRSELLSYNTIARSAGESIAPELWPDHAWVPALGVSGGRIPNVCRHGADALLGAGSVDWGPDGVNHTLAGTAYWNLPTSIKSETASNASLVMWHKREKVPTIADETVIWELGGGVTDHYYYHTNGSAYLGAFRSARASLYSLGTIALQPHVLSITSEPGTSGWKAYYNSRLMSAQTGDAAIGWTSGTPKIGQGLTPTWYYTGTFYSFSFYWRTLSAQEIATISADPLLPFRRRRSVRYFLPMIGSKFFPHIFGRVA